MGEMQRTPSNQTVTIGATTGASTTIEKGREVSGSFQLPSGSGTTQVTIYSELQDGLGWAVPNDEDGILLQPITVAAGGIYLLPDALFKVPRFKLVASAGDATEDVPLWLTS